MSLWTPGGDEPREPRPTPTTGPAPTTPGPGEDAARSLTDEEIAGLLAVREEMRATPTADVIANHAVGLYQLALLQLGADGLPPEIAEPLPPNLPEARLAIDALGALVEGLGERLGAHAELLGQALAQLRMFYVQMSQTGTGAGAGAEAEPGA